MKINRFKLNMPTYLLDNDDNYMMLLFYILKDIDVDTCMIIYDTLIMHEIIETMTIGWSELIVDDNLDIDELFDDLELYRDQ